MNIKSCIFINDNDRTQLIFREALNTVSPYTVCFDVSNGRQALHLMRKENLTPSYILAEMECDTMSGLEFLKTIKQMDKLKNVPVIVHATSLELDKLTELKESGALAIYYRPYEYYSICNMLQLYFGSEMAGILPN